MKVGCFQDTNVLELLKQDSLGRIDEAYFPSNVLMYMVMLGRTVN
jgi:hypothetical protein